ncbi:MAG: LytR/AlgR family response regulator transcription factor [Marinicellaceae bacterium]
MNEKYTIKALIIDDSRLARVELKHLLKTHNAIEVIGESASAKKAISLIGEKKPDVIFLDIQMPVMDGFELLQQLDSVPEVVFVTAFDQYAVKAFQHNALDYLQKPIAPADLSRAVDKLENKIVSSIPQIESMQRVFVKDGEKCWFIEINKIKYFEVDGNYTTVFFEDNQPMIPKTLNYLESRLDSKVFFRANRNQIINIKHIEIIEPWMQGFRVILSGGKHIELSRRQTQKFKELMSF